MASDHCQSDPPAPAAPAQERNTTCPFCDADLGVTERQLMGGPDIECPNERCPEPSSVHPQPSPSPGTPPVTPAQERDKQRFATFDRLAATVAVARVLAENGESIADVISELRKAEQIADEFAAKFVPAPSPSAGTPPVGETALDVEALTDYIVAMGAMHDDECPGDDTCGCHWAPVNAAANGAAAEIIRLRAQVTALEQERDEAARFIHAALGRLRDYGMGLLMPDQMAAGVEQLAKNGIAHRQRANAAERRAEQAEQRAADRAGAIAALDPWTRS